jgi:uncharacterized protein YuzE
MRIKYDSRADAAYIWIADDIGQGGVASTYLCNPIEIQGMINLDFDADGHLVGIEVMDASKRLPPEALLAAE